MASEQSTDYRCVSVVKRSTIFTPATNGKTHTGENRRHSAQCSKSFCERLPSRIPAPLTHSRTQQWLEGVRDMLLDGISNDWRFIADLFCAFCLLSILCLLCFTLAL